MYFPCCFAITNWASASPPLTDAKYYVTGECSAYMFRCSSILEDGNKHFIAGWICWVLSQQGNPFLLIHCHWRIEGNKASPHVHCFSKLIKMHDISHHCPVHTKWIITKVHLLPKGIWDRIGTYLLYRRALAILPFKYLGSDVTQLFAEITRLIQLIVPTCLWPLLCSHPRIISSSTMIVLP